MNPGTMPVVFSKKAFIEAVRADGAAPVILRPDEKHVARINEIFLGIWNGCSAIREGYELRFPVEIRNGVAVFPDGLARAYVPAAEEIEDQALLYSTLTGREKFKMACLTTISNEHDHDTPVSHRTWLHEQSVIVGSDRSARMGDTVYIPAKTLHNGPRHLPLRTPRLFVGTYDIY